jgi:hypothetical protein
MRVAKVKAKQNAFTRYARRRRRITAVDRGSIPRISTMKVTIARVEVKARRFQEAEVLLENDGLFLGAGEHVERAGAARWLTFTFRW